jgi:hypothetical protein
VLDISRPLPLVRHFGPPPPPRGGEEGRAATLRVVLLSLIAAVLLATPAHAQPLNAAALAGRWSIATAPHHDTGCVLTGEARATPTTRADTLRIELRVKSECGWGAQETCTGTLRGAHFAVTCTLISSQPQNYAADNFALEVSSADEMRGRLNDYNWWDEPAVWRRLRAGLVS